MEVKEIHSHLIENGFHYIRNGEILDDEEPTFSFGKRGYIKYRFTIGNAKVYIEIRINSSGKIYIDYCPYSDLYCGWYSVNKLNKKGLNIVIKYLKKKALISAFVDKLNIIKYIDFLFGSHSSKIYDKGYALYILPSESPGYLVKGNYREFQNIFILDRSTKGNHIKLELMRNTRDETSFRELFYVRGACRYSISSSDIALIDPLRIIKKMEEVKRKWK